MYETTGKPIGYEFRRTRDAEADGSGAVSAIAHCGPLCFLHSKLGRMTLWEPWGEFIGSVDLGELLGLEQPWASAFDVASARTVRKRSGPPPRPNADVFGIRLSPLYLAVGQIRQGVAGVAEGNVFRVMVVGPAPERRPLLRSNTDRL